MTETIALLPFAAAHIPEAVRLSRQAGWPHRAEDWAFTAAVSKGVVALEGGRVVGTAFCSELGAFCTINMIIVDEAMRGRGLGRRLMDAVMAAAEGRGMSLVATAEGQPLYEKLGFCATGTIAQYQGVVGGLPDQVRVATRDAGGADLPGLAAMDAAACGTDRSALLTNLLEVGRIVIAENGFAVLRDFGRGRVVGPVVARDAETARALIAELAEPGTFLRVDTNTASGIADVLTAMGLAHVGGGTTMHCGPSRPAAKDFTTYALTSQALG